jgi:hypothetical protein
MQPESFDLAAHQVGDARLSHAEDLSRIDLSQSPRSIFRLQFVPRGGIMNQVGSPW